MSVREQREMPPPPPATPVRGYEAEAAEDIPPS